MMMKRNVFYGAVLLLAMASPLKAAGPFAVRADGGNFAILYRGKVLVKTIEASNLEAAAPELRRAEKVMPDGTKVWNLWREDREKRIRLEIALGADGSQVEISMKGEARPYAEFPDRLLKLAVPMAAIDGKNYEGLTVNTRMWKPAKGTFGAKTPQGDLNRVAWRYFNITGRDGFNVVFDVNPIGVGDYCAQYSCGVIKGVWKIARRGGDLVLTGGSHLNGIGGMTGAKVVLREGVMARDYPYFHALKSYRERAALDVNYALSFGSRKHGREFTAADDAPFDPAKGYGWLGEVKLTRHNDAPEGIYYSSMSGRDATFRFAGLPPGVHIFTVTAGNFAGHSNRFSLTINGKSVFRDFSLPKARMAAASMPVWVGRDGIADLRFDGDFLVSGIAAQRLIAEAEDFSFRRGFWVADGFEPAVLFRNQDYRPEAPLTPALDLIVMPEPGKETAAPLKKLAKPVELPPDSPELEWRGKANFYHLGGNTATLDECRDPADMKRAFDRLQKDGAEAIMVNGMMSRHTYPAHLDRSVEMIGKLAETAHRRGMKLVDHQDVTLLWNCDSGFRVMAERLPETIRTMTSMTPNGQFCIMNPVLTRKYYDYALKTVRAGIDGLQADEATFMLTFCGCSHCRNRFYEDTGWQLPLNELDPRLFNNEAPLWKTFLEWRKVKIGNWWVDFRREAKKINPHLTLCMYSTHWGFMSRASSLAIGGDLLEEARAINYFGTEIMTRNCLQSARAVLPCRRMVNLLRAAFGTPIWSWVYGGIDGERMYEAFYVGWAICNMTGQSALTRWTNPPRRQSTFKSFEGNPDNMNRAAARPVAKVALLFTGASRDWNRGMNMYTGVLGFAQTLEELHIPYEVIGAMSLTPEVLQKYSFLSVGCNGCLSDGQLEAVKDFARRGGKVHLMGGAGMQDEMGYERPVWGFADVMGFNLKRPTRRSVIKKVGFRRDGSDAEELLVPTSWFTPAVMPKSSSLYGFTDKGKAVPAFIEKPCGKGRFIYEMIPLSNLLFCDEGRINEPWRFELDEKLAVKYRGLLRRMIGKAAYWTVDAPEKVYTSLYRQDKALVVHFLNAQGAELKKGELLPMKIPAVPFPPLRKPITFTLPVKTATEVYAVSPDYPGRQALEFRKNDDRSITVTLPEKLLHAYTIVWIK